MRRFLLMVFAMAALVGMTATGSAVASGNGKTGTSSSSSSNSGSNSGQHRRGKCPEGTSRSGKGNTCRTVVVCPGDTSTHHSRGGGHGGHGGHCRADDNNDDDHNDDNDDDDPPVVVPPEQAPCKGATIVLLRRLIPGTGPLDTIVCLFLGSAAAGATPENCPGGIVIGPVGTNLVGACLFVNNGVTDGPGVALLPPLDGAGAGALPLPGADAPGLPALDGLLSGSLSLSGTGSGGLGL